MYINYDNNAKNPSFDNVCLSLSLFLLLSRLSACESPTAKEEQTKLLYLQFFDAQLLAEERKKVSKNKHVRIRRTTERKNGRDVIVPSVFEPPGRAENHLLLGANHEVGDNHRQRERFPKTAGVTFGAATKRGRLDRVDLDEIFLGYYAEKL
jgi:hypothetical protein